DLLKQQREVRDEVAGKVAALNLHQKALEALRPQRAPLQKYVDDLGKVVDGLKQTLASLQSMTGPLVAAGTVSDRAHPGWIQVAPHLWAKDAKAAAGVSAAASLYEEAVWNGMVGQAIYKQIAIVQWQLNAVNGQARQAVADLAALDREIKSHEMEAARLTGEI